MERAIEESKIFSPKQKAAMKDRLAEYYEKNEKKYGKGEGLTTGEIAIMFGKQGGGIQHDMPFNMKELSKMKMIRKVRMNRK